MSTQLFTAIIYTSIPQVGTNKQFLKYRSINNIEKFKKFAIMFPGAQYVNLYDKKTKQFIRREYLK